MSEPIEIRGDAAFGIIMSPQFEAYPMGDRYRALARRFDIDFSAIIALMDHLPVFVNGDIHKTNRRAMAEIYGASRKQQERNVDVALDAIQKMLLQREGELDIVAEISLPLWNAVSAAFIQDTAWNVDRQLIGELPNLFSPHLSIRRRKTLNDRLAGALDACPAGDRTGFLDLMSVLVLGVRPLTHSLALSLYALAERNPGKKLSDISYPDSYLNSALRYVDRMALKDGEIAGCPHKSGSRLRCINFDEAYSEADNAKYFFGAGKHLCLGRPVSMYIWQHMAQMLGQIDKTVTPARLSIIPREPFLIARECVIAVSS